MCLQAHARALTVSRLAEQGLCNHACKQLEGPLFTYSIEQARLAGHDQDAL